MSREIGFVSPHGIFPDLEGTHFAQIFAVSPDAARENLSAARQLGLRVHICFEKELWHRKAIGSLVRERSLPDGSTYRKKFPPLPSTKIRQLNTDHQIKANLDPYAEVFREYRDVIDCLFLPDEPYLNGISKAELERGARFMRAWLDKAGLPDAGVAVNFAAAMFDPDFATHVQEEAWQICQKADAYSDKITAENAPDRDEWHERYRSRRITTYDMAGNLYSGGGIPAGVDLVSYDFYNLSAMNDRVFGRACDHFFRTDPEAKGPCARFAGRPMAQILAKTAGDPRDDDAFMDDLFECRNGAILRLLRRQAMSMPKPPRLMMMSRSGENRDASERRVQAEVQRALRFSARESIDLIFFLFDAARDHGIRLTVGGCRHMPKVMADIRDAAADQPIRSLA